MKKVLFLALVALFVSNVFAQNVEEIKKSVERIVKLQQLETAVTCKNEKINELA